MNFRWFFARGPGRWVILTAFVGLSIAGLTFGFQLDARYSWNRTYDAKHYHQIAIAMHAYHDIVGHFPSAAICGPDGTPLLSWRVEILPYLEDASVRFFKSPPSEEVTRGLITPAGGETFNFP